MEQAKKLVHFIETLPNFEIQTDVAIGYDHMGAIIVDAGLQAGIRYETAVKPRVNHILQTYPNDKTTSAFQRILMIEGAPNLLNWKVDRKINTIVDVVQFFISEKIETAADLRQWLTEPINTYRLKEIKGIGNKTADYFKILAGISTSAIDRHIYNFLSQAGITINGYTDAQQIIKETAHLLNISERALDYSIWAHMANAA